MKSIIPRHAVRVILVSALGLSLTGCATYAMNDVIRGSSSETYGYRVDRDVRRYVNNVDRRARLDRRQEQRVYRLLRDRTYRLLDHTRASNHWRVYPFPRREYRRMNSAQRKFWRDVDRRIERTLTRSQVRRYRGIFVRDNVRIRPHVERSTPRRGSRVDRRGERENDRGRRANRRGERDDDRDWRSNWRGERDDDRDRRNRSRDEREDDRVEFDRERDDGASGRRRSESRDDD